MARVIVVKKTNRRRCTDSDFIQAINSSETYEEIAQKTGQKLSTTISRYKKLKRENILQPNVFIHSKKQHKKCDAQIIRIVKRLSKYKIK